MFNFEDSFMFERMFEFRYRDRLFSLSLFYAQMIFSFYPTMFSLSVGDP